MTETVQITLIIVSGLIVVLLIALWMFKDRLDVFSFTANKKKVTAKMERHQNTGATISGNLQYGNLNEIHAETNSSTIENNQQAGDSNLIRTTRTKKH
jgi:hypothetical protein